MRWIIGTSLRFRLLIIAVAAGVIVLGVTQLRSAPVDVIPEFTPPYAEIQTEALGLSADEVEQLITVPLEADLLNGVEGVEVIRSQSVPGLSSIVLVFEPGTDVYRARQLVEERLTQAHALPNVSQPPTLLQPLSSSSRVLMIALSSEQLSGIDQSVIARWTVRPRLMGVPGVANVSVFGMRDHQLQVQVDPERLRDQGVTLNQVIRSTGNAQVVSPLTFLEASTPGTGGFIETPQQRLQVRNVLEKLVDPGELGKIPVDGTGGRLRLTDVADVKVDHQPLIGDAVVGDGNGLLLVVEKFPGANTLEVTEGVEDTLEKLRPGLNGMRIDTSVFRPATYIEDALGNIAVAAIVGIALMALALAAFLFRWRSVLISLVAIPLALITAAVVLDLLGQSFNAITFAGLAVAVAIVIDDAVVGVANVARRLRQHSQTQSERSTASVVLEATHEVRSPLIYATLIVLLAIVPVVVMSGRPGAFFDPLALSYALAVGSALLVALTVTPALCMLLSWKARRPRSKPAVARRVGKRYAVALASFMRRPRTALLAGGACLVAALAVLPFLGTSVIPSFKDRDVLVKLDAAPGTSQPRMTQIATGLSDRLRALPGVDSVGAHVGRAVTSDQVVDVNSSEVWISIDSEADYDATMARIEQAVRTVPDVTRNVATYSSQRIRDVGGLDAGDNRAASDDIDVLTGSDEPLVVRVYGQDSEVLQREAGKVRQMVAGIDGVSGAQLRQPVAQPTLEIEVDLEKAQRLGIKPGDVRRAEAALLQGIQVGSVFEEQKVFDVIVKGVAETRRSVADVRNLLIDRPGGGHVRLGQVADVRETTTPVAVQREAVSRYADVAVAVSGRGLGAVASDIRSRLADLSFPLEYHAQVLRDSTDDEIGATQILGFAIAAALAMFLLLQAAFRSWRLAGLAMATVPVALTGGVLAALIFEGELALGALAGLLAVFAIAVRNGILFIRRCQTLADEGEPFGDALVQRGAREQLTPIIATATALAALAVPFAVLGARPGLEIVHPMALVILGGLITSTFLSLFVLPALYLRVGRAARPSALDEEELMYRWAGFDPAAPEPAVVGPAPLEAAPPAAVDAEKEAAT